MNRMKHPLHGFHHPVDVHDEARMRANGWVDDVPEFVPEPVEVVAEPVAEPAPTPEKPRKKRNAA